MRITRTGISEQMIAATPLGMTTVQIFTKNQQQWRVRPLDPGVVRTVDRSGGTFLHTSRTNPGRVKPSEAPAGRPWHEPRALTRIEEFGTQDPEFAMIDSRLRQSAVGVLCLAGVVTACEQRPAEHRARDHPRLRGGHHR